MEMAMMLTQIENTLKSANFTGDNRTCKTTDCSTFKNIYCLEMMCFVLLVVVVSTVACHFLEQFKEQNICCELNRLNMAFNELHPMAVTIKRTYCKYAEVYNFCIKITSKCCGSLSLAFPLCWTLLMRAAVCNFVKDFVAVIVFACFIKFEKRVLFSYLLHSQFLLSDVLLLEDTETKMNPSRQQIIRIGPENALW